MIGPELSDASWLREELDEKQPRNESADVGPPKHGVMFGDPNRTSFELRLNSDLAICLSDGQLADPQRMVNERFADAPGRGPAVEPEFP